MYTYTPPATAWTQIGTVAAGQTVAFPNQPDGVKVHVTTTTAIGPTDGTISGGDLRLTLGGRMPDPVPPPVAGGYRVTVALQKLDVVNGGDDLDDPGDLYWEVNVVQRTQAGPIQQLVSQANAAIRPRSFRARATNGRRSTRKAAATPLMPRPA